MAPTRLVSHTPRGPVPPPSAAAAARSRPRVSGAGGPLAFHEGADTAERLLQALIGGRVARPDVALARRPERAARHDRDVLLLEQPRRERLAVEAGRRGHLGEGVERADDEATPAVVLRDHRLDVTLTVGEGAQRGVLGGRWGRHDRVLVHLD